MNAKREEMKQGLEEELRSFSPFRLELARWFASPAFGIGMVAAFVLGWGLLAVLLAKFVSPIVAVAVIAAGGFASVALGGNKLEMHVGVAVFAIIGAILVPYPALLFVPGAVIGFFIFICCLLGDYLDKPNQVKSRLEAIENERKEGRP